MFAILRDIRDGKIAGGAVRAVISPTSTGAPICCNTPPMMPPDELRAALLSSFPDATIQVTDLTGTQDHYEVSIVSQAFAKKTRIQQHKLVYAALGPAMRGPIHALALTTSAPESASDPRARR